jgi:hypothetical protein
MGNQLLTQFTWWSTNALEGLLILRAVRGRYFWKYPVFYLYLSYVLCESLLRFYFYIFRPDLFPMVYWISQFVSVTVGYCVILEIYRQALATYPGATRLARVCLVAIFVAVVTKVFLSTASRSVFLSGKAQVDLERDLRVAQAALIATIVVLVAYYAIPIGRNLMGMILGYGVFIGMTVIHLALRSHLGVAFQPVWQHLGWVSYSAALLIWCATLWSYHPSPHPSPEVEIERDYQRLALRTARLLTQFRAELVRVIRP